MPRWTPHATGIGVRSALFAQRGPRRPVYRTVHAAAAEHAGVGRVDNRIALQVALRLCVCTVRGGPRASYGCVRTLKAVMSPMQSLTRQPDLSLNSSILARTTLAAKFL